MPGGRVRRGKASVEYSLGQQDETKATFSLCRNTKMDSLPSTTGSVTMLLRQLSTADERVIQEVFDFYFQGLMNRAKRLLANMGGSRISSEEDLAMIVMTSFLRDASAGKLGPLRSRTDAWRMLYKRIRLRAINMIRDERRLTKLELSESALGFDDIGGQCENTQACDSFGDDALNSMHDELIARLPGEMEKTIVNLLIEGWEIAAIAKKLRRSPTTIYRKIRIIKDCWIRAT